MMMMMALILFYSDREKPVNIGDSMPATLIRLMTSTMLSQTREAVSECLFSLCNDDGMWIYFFLMNPIYLPF